MQRESAKELSMKPPPQGWPRISSAVFYENAAQAIDWLCRAFGFEVRLKVEGERGRIEHSELAFGEGLIVVHAARPARGVISQSTMFQPSQEGRYQ
jgi:uncharacterized glyoxalase superfamily protein PhnB